MDNKPIQPVSPPTQPSQPLPPTQPPIPPSSQQNAPVPGQTKTTHLSDEEARSLLTINQLNTKEGSKSPKTFLVAVIVGVVLVVALTLFIQSRNHPSSKSSSSSSSVDLNPSTSPLGKGSIDSQVKYCSNPINATLSC